MVKEETTENEEIIEPLRKGASITTHSTPKGRETVALQASVTKTSTFTGTAVNMPNHAKSAIAFLDVSAASGTSPTLDVTLEMQDPVGTDYVEIGAFTQVTAALTAPQFLVIGLGADAAASVKGEEDDSILMILPMKLRAKATIGGTTPSFTYSVTLIVI